ncbi:hypothetical protein [Streptomyces sp. NPDC008092]|uniref:hypothetical protein n=1 Tax=Streptomyces sp. NPDC008092 TaxID=3364808 RepID=UPI0036EB08B3
MTSPAVLPGAVVRVVRTALGRRALQLALLVGGVLALGFLCGQQAQAAEGTAPASSPTSAVTPKLPLRDVVTPRRALEARKAVTGAVPLVSAATVTTATTVAPVVDGVHEVVRSVTDKVTTPVTTALTETLVETVRQVTELPVVQVPQLPVVSEPPAEPAPAPAPVTPAPGATHPRTPVAHGAGHDKPRTESAAETAPGADASYGPRITAVPFPSAGATHAGGHHVRTARAADGPARPAPAGDPDGALGKSAADGGPSRHGDAHAVTFADRAPLSLAPGAAARADAAGTRDRYRDIPLFPG